MLSLKIENLEEVLRAWNTFDRRFKNFIQQDMALTVAKEIEDLARTFAPIGVKGALKKSIFSKRLTRGVASKIGISYEKNSALVGADSRIAPHAGWVEYGIPHVRYPEKAKALANQQAKFREGKYPYIPFMASKILGVFFGKQVAPMRAKPFFRPAIDYGIVSGTNKVQSMTDTYVDEFNSGSVKSL